MAAEPVPQPLTLWDGHDRGPWECSTCAEDYHYMDFLDIHSKIPWRTKEGDLVCDNCIKGLFTQAMKYDIEWPARWGGTPLNILDYASIWRDGDDFVIRYELRREIVEYEQQQISEQSLADNVPEGFVQGIDFQRCPGCRTAISLWDGCNHMVCSCGSNFCYICGKAAHDGSAHWAPGGCPRYNQPGERNAIFDELIEQDDADSLHDVDGDADDFTSDMSFEVWTWNVTMQTTNERIRSIMQRMLHLPFPEVTRQGPVAREERLLVLNAMLERRPQHGVSDEEWQEIVNALHEDAHDFVMSEFDTEFDLDNTHTFPIGHGVLGTPIGGVFNLSIESGRREAYEWAEARKLAWRATDADNANNYAIFDIGPGGTRFELEAAANFLDLLLLHGETLTEGQVAFTQIVTDNATCLLVRYTGRVLEPFRDPQNTPNPLRGVQFDFFPIDPLMLAELATPVLPQLDAQANRPAAPRPLPLFDTRAHRGIINPARRPIGRQVFPQPPPPNRRLGDAMNVLRGEARRDRNLPPAPRPVGLVPMPEDWQPLFGGPVEPVGADAAREDFETFFQETTGGLVEDMVDMVGRPRRERGDADDDVDATEEELDAGIGFDSDL